jgi:Mrp family chromosome partitioning ATPase
VQVPGIQGLSILPVGTFPKSPADLLASEEMKELILRRLSEGFVHVILDSPPTIPFPDARILSVLVDAVVLVARYGYTTRRSLVRGAQILEEVGAPILGVVINGMDFGSPDYHYYNYGFSRGSADSRIYKYYRSMASPQTKMPPPPDKPKARGAGAGQ